MNGRSTIKRCEALLQEAGAVEVRQRGSHRIFKLPTGKLIILCDHERHWRNWRAFTSFRTELRRSLRAGVLLLLVLPLTGCVQRRPVEPGRLGEAVVRTIAPPFMSGETFLQRWDRERYTPSDENRDRTYFDCLNQTAGQGREPFDVCMTGKGYSR